MAHWWHLLVISLALLQLEGREKLDRPVHVLVLIRVDGSTVLRPADGGFGDAGGLAGQGGLNVDCDRHIVAALSDGWRHWRRRDDRITSVGGPKKKKGFCLQEHPPKTCRSTLFCCVPAWLVAMHRYRPVSVTWVEWMCNEPPSASVYLHTHKGSVRAACLVTMRTVMTFYLFTWGCFPTRWCRVSSRWHAVEEFRWRCTPALPAGRCLLTRPGSPVWCWAPLTESIENTRISIPPQTGSQMLLLWILVTFILLKEQHTDYKCGKNKK